MLTRFLVVGSFCALTACAPTISMPRGTEHLDALAEAEGHQHHGRDQEAVKAFGRAAESAERRVDKDEALYRQSRVYAHMKDYKNALAICAELAAADPPARRTMRAKLDAARYRMLLGETERADRELRAIVVENPDDAAAKGALRVLVQIHVREAETPEKALFWLKTLESELEEGNTTHEALLSLEAELLIGKGKRAEAVEVLESQIELYPYPHGRRWDNALWSLADLAMEDNDAEGAVKRLESMIAVHETSFIIGSYTRPMFSKAALRIARIYRDNLDDPRAALKAYERVRSEFPNSLVVDDALEEEAFLRIESGDSKKGCALLQEVVAKHEVGSARRRADERINRDCQ
jgi:tetratricopeptide (TPR) repeat protein